MLWEESQHAVLSIFQIDWESLAYTLWKLFPLNDERLNSSQIYHGTSRGTSMVRALNLILCSIQYVGELKICDLQTIKQCSAPTLFTRVFRSIMNSVSFLGFIHLLTVPECWLLSYPFSWLCMVVSGECFFRFHVAFFDDLFNLRCVTFLFLQDDKRFCRIFDMVDENRCLKYARDCMFG